MENVTDSADNAPHVGQDHSHVAAYAQAPDCGDRRRSAGGYWRAGGVCALAVGALTGCKTFDNLLVVSMTGDKAAVMSMWGPIGIASVLRDEDAAELRRMMDRASR